MAPFAFSIDATDGAARAARLATPHGVVQTPAFMPVGTLATVKSLDPDDLVAAGSQMILANAYHLHLRPGDEVVHQLGGLHRFMHWNGPILTDSGGFQVFSLETLRTVTEDGVEFQSHVDGSRRHFSPERVMEIERNLGADVIMQFDHVIPGQAERSAARDASERSLRWLLRCRREFERPKTEDRSISMGGAPPESTIPPGRSPSIINSWPLESFSRTSLPQALFPVMILFMSRTFIGRAVMAVSQDPQERRRADCVRAVGR